MKLFLRYQNEEFNQISTNYNSFYFIDSTKWVFAQGIKISWDNGFPQPGVKKRSINVQGSINIPGGIAGSTVGTARIILNPVGGGQKIIVNFSIPAGETGNVEWSATASMLNGNNYNVIVEVDIQITPNTQRI